jgi:hypothetical protein
VKRTLRDLVPRSGPLRRRLRQVLSGSAIASVGLSATQLAQAKDHTTATEDLSPVTIANRAQKAKKLILQMPDGGMFSMLQHRSHSSHSSHRSHSSHYSGSSSGTSRPAPLVTPTRPAPRVAEVAPPVADPAPVTYFRGVIDAINKDARTVTIKHADTNQPYTLGYRDDTTFRSLVGTESRLDDATDRNNGITGYTIPNLHSLWIDPWEYRQQLNDATIFLASRGVSVWIYNHQLCTLSPDLWRFSRRSISDWKNEYLAQCEQCMVRTDCGGFFASAAHRSSTSLHITPVTAAVAASFSKETTKSSGDIEARY